MDLNERIKLDRQTVETLERIRDNGGNVPDGYVLECSQDHNDMWVQHGLDIEVLEHSWWFRLTPTKPPRFTVSTDPCGVLDSERPGWIVDCSSTRHYTAGIAANLNSGLLNSSAYTWTQIPKPQIPLGPEDVPPGSVIMARNGPWQVVLFVMRDGVYVPSISNKPSPRVSFKDLQNDGWQIKRPGSDWMPCSKDA